MTAGERGELLYRIVVCRGDDCRGRNSGALTAAFRRVLENHGLEEKVKLLEHACFGKCQDGPNVVVGPRREEKDFLTELFGEAQYFVGAEGECLYSGVSPADVESIVTEHLLRGRPLERLLWRKP